MRFEPTPGQALLLFGLLGRHGECPQADMMPAVKKVDREALIVAKLTTAEKRGRGFYLSLTDAGWEWAGRNLDVELPPAQRALSDLLLRLGEHLERSGQTLADVIGSKRAQPSALALHKPEKPKATSRKTSAAKAPTPASLRKRIEAAYLNVTGQKKNRSVKLSRLRAELADLDRKTVDSALAKILAGDRKASLMRHDDPKQLDSGDHEAAFSPAGEPFHVLWIAS